MPTCSEPASSSPFTLSLLGIVSNSILLYTTIRSKSLRMTCNILIGVCALFDVLHQIGTFPMARMIYFEIPMDSWTCDLIMIIPELGCAAGSFTVLSIGIDRILCIIMPNRYDCLTAARNYLTVHILAIFIFCAYDVFLVVEFFQDEQVDCQMPSAYHGVARLMWAGSAAGVNVIAGVVYTMVALENGKKQWITKSIIALIGILTTVFASGVVIVYCLVRVLRETTATNIHLESKTKQMQRQLFRALLWQTIIPTCTSYIPLALILLIPLIFQTGLDGVGTLILMSTQLFPMIDPFLILFFVQGYRTALPRFIRQVGIIPFTIDTAKSTTVQNIGPSAVAPTQP